jgi:hypothetical protein
VLAVKHREIYMALLSPLLRDRLLAALNEEGILTLLKAHASCVVDAEPEPYVRLAIKAGEDGIIAHCTGVWLDVRPLVGPDGQDDYYLPVLGVADGASASTVAHELLHLRDMLALIEQDPTYPDRALKLSINSISYPSEIEQSVDFEMLKIFSMEPQAYRLEYEMGETWIETSVAGLPVRYACANADELVAMHMADYVAKVERWYSSKFPGHEATIRRAVRRSANRHGRAVFGASAHERIQQENARTSVKLVMQLLQRRSA